MEQGKTKKKILIAVILFVCLIAVGLILFLVLKMNAGPSFEENEAPFFRIFAKTYGGTEYKIKSLDAYYYDDSSDETLPSGFDNGTYYFHIVYSFYWEPDQEWCDIDEVDYGSNGKIENSYCLSWDTLSGTGFEKVNEEFQQAVKNGVHKSYDISKFQEYLDKYKDED